MQGQYEIYEGTIEDIIFRNESNGYTVAVMSVRENEPLTITGNFVSLEIGDHLEVKGERTIHPSYGVQFKVTFAEHKAPASEEAIMAFLCSGVLEGVGRKMAERIFEKFGLNTLDVMDNEPERLIEVEGIGRRKLERLLESYRAKRDLNLAILKLSQYGISSAMAMKIHRFYGEHAIGIIEENPYCLCRDIKGIGFRKADEIARKIGIETGDINRLMQGIVYLLQEAGGRGHTYLPEGELIYLARDLLRTEEEKIDEAIYELCVQGFVVMQVAEEERRLYLEHYHETENAIANALVHLLGTGDEIEDVQSEDLIQAMEDKTGISLAEKQKQAVSLALGHKVMILTGGPGTGKTTVVKFILRCFEDMKKKVFLCAPTGRAAKRLSESADKEAKTIHRLLEVGFSDDDEVNFYNRDESNPLEADVVIVDEMSMVDIFLMKALLRALPTGARLVMIGDADQLPSVGAGNVLRDMIDSGLIPTVTLTEIFRQKEESGIIINAHRVNKGESLVLEKGSGDFFFMKRREKHQVRELVLELITQRLPEYYDLKPHEIQILTPIRKGDVGVHEFNRQIQQVLNPASKDKPEFRAMDVVFREGDKVMQIKNNYQKKYRSTLTYEEGEGVFNGDIGYIDAVDTTLKQFYITFDDNRRCRYEFAEADNVEHAYAITVHKSQGSEFDVVIIPILSLPPMLQNRNILYTAITRAKKALVLVGETYYVDKMIRNINLQPRYSSLNEKLKMMKQTCFEQEELPF